MMINTVKHSIHNLQPRPQGSLAYWSLDCATMFSSNDRTSEINRVQEDTV